MKKITVMTVFGTRPEAIKMAPLVKAFQQNHRFTTVVAVTAQHREMLDQVLDSFGIVPDYDLDIMQQGQSLTAITTRVLSGLGAVLDKNPSAIVLVHGDTSTTFAASLASFYRQIPVGHVEAGLRTFNKYSPFPEELNRRLTGTLADLHFAPTENAKHNLLNEGVPPHAVFVTGNTIIDALTQTVRDGFVFAEPALRRLDTVSTKTLLLTAHRRENLGRPMENIFTAVKTIAASRPDIRIVFPVHPNKKIKGTAEKILGRQKNILLAAPLAYGDFVNLMSQCYMIITDSGGIQEEASALGKPVLVLRDTTERGEALECGAARMIGTDTQNIISEAEALLNDAELYRQMAGSVNPFGDGKASQRIVRAVSSYFGLPDDVR